MLHIDILSTKYWIKMHIYKLSFAICLICVAVVQDAISSFTTLNPIEGDHVTIHCNDSFPPSTIVHWTRSGDDAFSRNGVRLKMAVSRNDSGNYTCFWNGGPYNNTSVDTVYINVQYPVRVSYFSVEPVYALENQMVTVLCRTDGNPEPTKWIESNATESDWYITDYIPNELLENNTINFKIGLLTRRCGESVEIACRGENKLDIGGPYFLRTAYRNQTVFTSCPPRPTDRKDRVITTGRGDNVYLGVPMTAYPTPSYTWSRDDGQPLREPERFNGSKVHLLNLVASDFGNYTMTASNQFGNYTETFYLINDGKYYGHTGLAPQTVAGFITMVIVLLSSMMLSRYSTGPY